jgi:stress-induced morphogen
MLKLMQKKALLLYVEAEKGTSESNSIGNSDIKDDSYVENSSGPSVTPSLSVDFSSEIDDENVALEGRGKRIKEKLEKELHPIELEVEDVSYQHAGHAGVRGSNGETHFNVKVVSEEFQGKSLVKRHRLIYNLLQDELESGLHALSIVAKTPSEVGKR